MDLNYNLLHALVQEQTEQLVFRIIKLDQTILTIQYDNITHHIADVKFVFARFDVI